VTGWQAFKIIRGGGEKERERERDELCLRIPSAYIATQKDDCDMRVEYPEKNVSQYQMRWKDPVV
jgi:hypothetical protein